MNEVWIDERISKINSGYSEKKLEFDSWICQVCTAVRDSSAVRDSFVIIGHHGSNRKKRGYELRARKSREDTKGIESWEGTKESWEGTKEGLEGKLASEI